MSASITLTGDRVLDKKFRQMTAKLQNKVVKQSVRVVAKDVLTVAKTRVPVDTGDLEDSLTVRKAKVKNARRRGIIADTVVTRTNDNNLHENIERGVFSGDQFYGGFIEFGWEHYRAGHIPADSFLRYAIYTDKSRRLQMFASEMSKRLRMGVLK